MTTIQVTLQHPWQLVTPRVCFSRYFKFHELPYSARLLELHAIFVSQEDARTWAKIQRWTGKYVRTKRLPVKVQQRYGQEYQWGVWVTPIQEEES